MYKLISTVFLAVSFSMAVPGAGVAQEISTRQVYEAAQAGRMAEAQQMMDKVLRDHPNSAKAHYVQAELLAKQGRYGEAKGELETARRLAPGLPFAKPQSVQALNNLVSGTRSTPRASEQSVPSQSAGFPWGFLVVLVLAGGAVFLLIRAIRSRRPARMAGGLPANYAQGAGAQPPYGPSPMPGAPGGGGLGSGPGGGAPGGGGLGGGGLGAGILGGLATGAAMGVGAVAAQQLMHHFTDQDRPGSGGVSPPQQDPNVVPFDDMGGQDFGITDNSSWDDSGSGSDISGGDW